MIWTLLFIIIPCYLCKHIKKWLWSWLTLLAFVGLSFFSYSLSLYSETCLNRTPNKPKSCVRWTLNKVAIQEIFVYWTCINRIPFYFKQNKVRVRQVSLYLKDNIPSKSALNCKSTHLTKLNVLCVVHITTSRRRFYNVQPCLWTQPRFHFWMQSYN